MDLLEISKSIVTFIFTIIGIIVSIYTTLHSLNKKSKIDISRERLELVYYPLMNELKSFSYSYTKGFDLHYYLHDKMKDEKYLTLLDSKKIEIEFGKLSRLFSEDTSVLNSEEISNIYSNMDEEIKRQYRKAKCIIGYETDYMVKVLYCAIFAYTNLLLFGVFINDKPNSLIVSTISIPWSIIILLSIFLTIKYGLRFIRKNFSEIKGYFLYIKFPFFTAKNEAPRQCHRDKEKQ